MPSAAVSALTARRPPALPVWDDTTAPELATATAGWGRVDIDPFTRWWPQLPALDGPVPDDPF